MNEKLLQDVLCASVGLNGRVSPWWQTVSAIQGLNEHGSGSSSLLPVHAQVAGGSAADALLRSLVKWESSVLIQVSWSGQDKDTMNRGMGPLWRFHQGDCPINFLIFCSQEPFRKEPP